MFESAKAWCLKQWKAIVAITGLVFAALMMYLRSRDQKKILDYTNKSHKAEDRVNEKAKKDLVTGLENIHREKDESLADAEERHQKDLIDLEKKKKDFVEETKKDENLEDLAKSLADSIGADFVE